MNLNKIIPILITFSFMTLCKGQSSGNFWWMNQKLIDEAKISRESKDITAHVIKVEPDYDDIKPVTEIVDDIPPPPLTLPPIRLAARTTQAPPTQSTSRQPRKFNRNFLFPDEVTPRNNQPQVQFLNDNNLDSIDHAWQSHLFRTNQILGHDKPQQLIDGRHTSVTYEIPSSADIFGQSDGRHLVRFEDNNSNENTNGAETDRSQLEQLLDLRDRLIVTS